jgi:hypothetical protein
MDAAKELEAKVEAQIERSAERVIEGQVDSTDNKTRYLGASLPSSRASPLS